MAHRGASERGHGRTHKILVIVIKIELGRCNMTEIPDTENALSPPPGSTPSEMFPVLTSGQQARVLAHGQHRTVEQGEIVVELNEHVTKFFVVVSGQLHILQVSNNQEHVVAICNPGMFTGELNVLLIVRDLQDEQLSAD